MANRLIFDSWLLQEALTGWVGSRSVLWSLVFRCCWRSRSNTGVWWWTRAATRRRPVCRTVLTSPPSVAVLAAQTTVTRWRRNFSYLSGRCVTSQISYVCCIGMLLCLYFFCFCNLDIIGVYFVLLKVLSPLNVKVMCVCLRGIQLFCYARVVKKIKGKTFAIREHLC